MREMNPFVFLPLLLSPSLSSPFPSLPFPPLLFRPPSSSLPLVVGPLKTARSLGSAVSSLTGVWGEFGAF